MTKKKNTPLKDALEEAYKESEQTEVASEVRTEEIVQDKVETGSCTIRNKTNQKQLVPFNGETLNLAPLSKTQLQESVEVVSEKLDFWVRKEIISITKN